MSTTGRVLAVLGLLVFLVAGVAYVGWASSKQEALERVVPVGNRAAELAAMTDAERSFVQEITVVVPQLGSRPSEAVRYGHKVCDLLGLPQQEVRNEVMDMLQTPYYTPARAEATLFIYKAKYLICGK